MDKKIVHSVFEDIAKRSPFHVAIEEKDATITYDELNRYGNRISQTLRAAGNRPGKVVAVAVPASIRLVGSLLAVFKCGSIYMPIDLASPEKRLRRMFELAFEGTIIVAAEQKEVMMEMASRWGMIIDHLIVVGPSKDIQLYSSADGILLPVTCDDHEDWQNNMSPEITGDSSSYIFFTSGSTGEGKAILGKHASLSHFIHWEIGEFGIDASFRISQLTQVTFDASLRDIFAALISGGTLCIPPAEIRDNPARLLGWIDHTGINMLHCVPSLFRVMTRELDLQKPAPFSLRHLKYILMAGEPLYAKDILSWRQVAGEGVHLVNLYGATETTLIKTFYRIGEVPEDHSHIIPAGRPISNTSIAIIREQRICHVGETGEIYVKTPFATKGYYKDPALTNQCFVQNPLTKDKTDIVYKTGDIGRYLPDGNIEVLGRTDSQVKINGVRVELMEVERAMLAHENVTGVVVKTHAGHDNLITLLAYYTGVETIADHFRQMLMETLPPQAIPSFFVHMEAFPLNSNGKTDRKNLPLPDKIQAGDTPFEWPLGEIEHALAACWREVLGHETIGRDISFFNIGGHSLRAIQLISRIHRIFGIELKVVDIFRHNTIRSLGRLLSDSQGHRYSPIRPVNEQPDYAMSPSQRRLWFLSQIGSGNIAYNTRRVYIFEGCLDPGSLEHALGVLIRRHDSLRTLFKENEQGEIRQFILPPEAAVLRIKIHDLRHAGDEHVKALVKEELLKPFDLASAPLLRVGLIRMGEEKWIFVYVMHHIVSDGWSMNVLLRELLMVYNARVQGNAHPLTALRIQYKDYTAWLLRQLEGERLAFQKKYWLKQFEGELPVLQLPGDFVRPAVKTYNGGSVVWSIDPRLVAGLKVFLSGQQGTMFMGLLAMVNALLYRYTGQNDIVIGSPVAGRAHVDLEDQIGIYINTLALRTRFSEDASYDDLLKEVRRTTLDAYEHQLYPFDELIGELHLHRDMSRNALFDVLLILQNTKNHRPLPSAANGLEIKAYEGDEEPISKFDLTFIFEEAGEGLMACVEYNSDIFHRDSILRLKGHFEQLLKMVLAYPLTPLHQLDLLDQQEKTILSDVFNEPAMAYPVEGLIMDLFSRQVKADGDRTAVISGEAILTYRELHERSNRLGWYLRDRYNVRPDSIVAIKLQRNEWMLTAILGVLKSGAAYLPIDPAFPRDRIDYMITDSGCMAVIDEEELDNFRKASYLYPTADLTPVNKPSDLMYVIYTSGSTGRPKGVLIEHRSVVSMFRNYDRTFFLTPDIVFAATSNYTFDVSVLELLGPIVHGAHLFLVADTNPMHILGCLEQHKFDVLQITPSRLNQLLETGTKSIEILGNLKVLLIGGEALTLGHYQLLKRLTNTRVINVYGPTETTIWSTCLEISASEYLSIGKPLLNECIFITDDRRAMSPIGVMGEICIGGEGLARGYMSNPVLTAEKFISNPFRPGERMYRTGDIGRWLPDGNIEISGRKDGQVKIRGYRIEPGEIENVLQDHEDISAAAVVARQDGEGQQSLVAYVVCRRQMDVNGMKAYLGKALPAYMIPAHFIQLSRLPMNSNGKIDKKALPDPDPGAMQEGTPFVPPADDMEAQLVAVYEDVLKLHSIGMKHDFFMLGGDSISSIRIAVRLRKIGFSVDIQDIMAYPVLEDLCYRIKSAGSIPRTSTTEEMAVPRQGGSFVEDASCNQLFYLSHWEMKGAVVVLKYDFSYIDIPAFETAVHLLIQRHEILRTVFVRMEDGFRQKVLPLEDLQFSIGDMTMIDSEEEMRSIVERERKRKFQANVPPLLHVTVYRRGSDRYSVLFTIHHVITDGYSVGVLQADLLSLYSRNLNGTGELDALPLQYKDYSAWQKRFLRSDAGIAHRRYWLNKLKGFHPEVRLPRAIELADTAEEKETAIYMQAIVDGSLFEDLDRLGRDSGLTRPVILLGILILLLSQLSDQDDITIATYVSGRDSKYFGEMDIKGLIGLFTTILFVRNTVDREKTVMEFLRDVRRGFIDDISFATYPFAKVIEDQDGLALTGGLLDSLIFYNYHNYDYLKGAAFAANNETDRDDPAEVEPMQGKYALAVKEYKNCLVLDFKFSPHLVLRSEGVGTKHRYMSLLRQALQDPMILIREMQQLNYMI